MAPEDFEMGSGAATAIYRGIRVVVAEATAICPGIPEGVVGLTAICPGTRARGRGEVVVESVRSVEEAGETDRRSARGLVTLPSASQSCDSIGGSGSTPSESPAAIRGTRLG